ncbi:hypothetical protein IE077_003151 [Cardiosporidium cionae]|uniref:Uncharacterized protein n=1 Tax=Cardiosporidium cionae TaxID=476202 RepID=A0ABQ7JF90_9APIC|nr:hypothetical protein IE077_003151 [Cardiosporidium cionae]|eukprot:KAF8822682.1 hypothetical protein IE077_003151 [Cardiosporidium cionae]
MHNGEISPSTASITLPQQQAMQGHIEHAFYHWKYKNSDALGSTLAELNASTEQLYDREPDSGVILHYHLSSIIASMCTRFVDQSSKSTQEIALDRARHALETKRGNLITFILFLQDTHLFRFMDQSDRLYACSLFERLIGLQHLRHAHIQQEDVFNRIIIKFISELGNTLYDLPLSEVSSLSVEEACRLFYEKVSVSPYCMFFILEDLQEKSKQWLAASESPLSSAQALTVILLVTETVKSIRNYMNALLEASQTYSKHMQLNVNSHVEAYKKLELPFLCEPPQHCAFVWLNSIDYGGITLLTCLFSFVEISLQVYERCIKIQSDRSKGMTSSDASIGTPQTVLDFYQTLYCSIENTFAICVNILELSLFLHGLLSPLGDEFKAIKQKVFPVCLRLESCATQAFNFFNATTGACGFDYTTELAQKFLDIPTLLQISLWNNLNGGRTLYNFNMLNSQMLQFPEFRILVYQQIISEEENLPYFKHVLYRFPYELTNEAYKFLGEMPRLRWPLLVRLSQQKAEYTHYEGVTDWIDVALTNAVDPQLPEVLHDPLHSVRMDRHNPKVIEKAFLDMYAVGMGSDDLEERLFYLCMARAAAKGGGVEVPNYATSTLQCSSPNANFSDEVLEEDITHEALTALLQIEILENHKTPLKSTEVVLQVLQKLCASRISTSKERRRNRIILRDVARLLPRFILSGLRRSIFNMFWKLVIEVDSQLWAKLYEVDPTDIGRAIGTGSSYAAVSEESPDQAKMLPFNLCQHSLLYELLLKYDWDILRHMHSGDIRDVADEIDPRLASIIEKCFLFYENYRSAKEVCIEKNHL